MRRFLSSLQTAIAPILRVANEIQNERPRVAYLCRFYAFEKAHRLDETCSGLGVRQFKTALLQRLELDNAASASARVEKTDARELESFYKQHCEQHGVLFEVLCGAISDVSEEID